MECWTGWKQWRCEKWVGVHIFLADGWDGVGVKEGVSDDRVLLQIFTEPLMTPKSMLLAQTPAWGLAHSRGLTLTFDGLK